MRDAFGGVFMLRLLLVFIVILVAFGAISFKYAKSFRVKNKIIDYVEQNQIKNIESFFSEGSGNNNNKLIAILKLYDYNNSCEHFGISDGFVTNESTGEIYGYCQNGILIIENSNKSNKQNGTITYNVYTYVNWNLGILNKFLVLGGRPEDSEERIAGSWLISGEAVVKY